MAGREFQPGHDTPGGNADLIKDKVSSSIANLYRRPRVWLEGYHSLGWGATPERLMQATHDALWAGIEQVRVGHRLGEFSFTRTFKKHGAHTAKAEVK